MKERYRQFKKVVNYKFEETEERKRQVLNTSFIFYMIFGITLLVLAYMNSKSSTRAMVVTTLLGGTIAIIFSVTGKIFNKISIMSVGASIIVVILFT